MRQPLIVGNWKMNGTLAGVKKLASDIVTISQGLKDPPGMAVCPPFVYIQAVAEALRGSYIEVGAQDLCEMQGEGAFTGEVSGTMLKDIGCRYVIVAHSERRHGYGETDEWVAKKFLAAYQAKVTPILCVGELLEERESGSTEQVVGRQVRSVVDAVGIDVVASSVIAYEPVWAIGTGKTATAEQAQEVHHFIRKILTQYSTSVAEGLKILYGGSMKPSNASGLLAMPDIDGGLIGGASLKADDFVGICQAACGS